MIYAANLTTYTLNGTSQLSYFENVAVEVAATTEETKGGAARHALAQVVKRKFSVQTGIMNNASSVIKAALDLSVFSIGATDLKAFLRTFDITINTANQECSARADEFETFQATGTKFSGRFNLQISDTATSTLIDTVNGTRSGLATTVSVTIGATVIVLPIILTKATQKVERDGLITVDCEFEQRGTPTTITGNTLLAKILTGDSLVTAVVAFTNNDSSPASMGTYTGSTLIESATLSIPETGIVKESYTFKGLGQLVKS